MPLYKNKVLAGSQFTGLTPASGLFDPKAGSNQIQVRINSLSFHTDPSSDFSLYLVDPDDADNEILVLTDSNAGDLYFTQLLLPTENLYSWHLKTVTTLMTGDGWLTIDYDFQPTEGV